MKKGKKGKEEEDLSEQKLAKIPEKPSAAPEWSMITHVRMDGNQLTHKELKKLIKASPLLVECSAQKNWIVKVPSGVRMMKKLKKLSLEDNPIGWPLKNSKNDWKKAVINDLPGRKVYRMYLEEKDDMIHYADMEVIVMGEAMFDDKDEDRSDLKVGLPNGEVLTLDMHDRDRVNKFKDPDETVAPWYRVKSKNVFPIDFFSAGVFDGHGGSLTSTCLKQNMFKWVQKFGILEKEEKIEDSIREMYVDLDRALVEKTEAEGKADGSTCVHVLMTPKSTIVSHVGDSRCVLGLDNTHVVQVTKVDAPLVEIFRL